MFGGVAGIEAALEVSNIQLNFDEAGKDRERERERWITEARVGDSFWWQGPIRWE